MSKDKHTEPDVGYPPGTVFGDTYKINQLVGLGGMGEVYEVEHLRTHGKLALKVLNPMYSVDDKAIVRFRREAQMAAGVEHESIVHVFDVDQDSSGVWFIAMELLEGQTLKEILTREKVLTIRRAYGLAEKTDNTYKIANILHNLGHCFYSMKDFFKAGEYFESSVLICEREGFYSLRYINLAYIYYLNILRTSDGTFLDKMKECLSFARRFYDNWGLIQIRILMGRSHAHLKQKKRAAECFKLAVADARKFSFSSFVEEAEKALSELNQ